MWYNLVRCILTIILILIYWGDDLKKTNWKKFIKVEIYLLGSLFGIFLMGILSALILWVILFGNPEWFPDWIHGIDKGFFDYIKLG